jgi:hypothetical protein
MSHFVVRNRYNIPGFFVTALSSFAISTLVMTVVTIVLLIFPGTNPGDLLKNVPWPVAALLFICYLYSAIGSYYLYFTMWIYWIAAERSSIPARIGWFFVLLLGLMYGAIIYAFVIKSTAMVKTERSEPLAPEDQLPQQT